MKKVKLETSLDTTCDRTGWYYDKLFQVAAVEEQLQIQSSENRFAKISLEDMNAAAEMFIYLNTCPRSFKPWIEFYKYLFQTQSPNKIILSLNRIMKEALNQKDVFLKKLAHNLFKRMTPLLSLKYEEIQSILPTNQTLINDHADNLNFLEAKGSVYIFFCFFIVFFFIFKVFKSSITQCILSPTTTKPLHQP